MKRNRKKQRKPSCILLQDAQASAEPLEQHTGSGQCLSAEPVMMGDWRIIEGKTDVVLWVVWRSTSHSVQLWIHVVWQLGRHGDLINFLFYGNPGCIATPFLYVCIYIYSGPDSFTECLSPHKRDILCSNPQPKLGQSWHSGISREAIETSHASITARKRAHLSALKIQEEVRILPSPLTAWSRHYQVQVHSAHCMTGQWIQETRCWEKGTWLTKKMAD